jgi:hypothetical protein
MNTMTSDAVAAPGKGAAPLSSMASSTPAPSGPSAQYQYRRTAPGDQGCRLSVALTVARPGAAYRIGPPAIGRRTSC